MHQTLIMDLVRQLLTFDYDVQFDTATFLISYEFHHLSSCVFIPCQVAAAQYRHSVVLHLASEVRQR